jgi:hypothetical protein
VLILDVRLRAKRYGVTSPQPALHPGGRRRERHQLHVVLASDDEDALAAVTLGVRVPQDIEQVASLDVEDDFFEPDPAVCPNAAQEPSSGTQRQPSSQ